MFFNLQTLTNLIWSPEGIPKFSLNLLIFVLSKGFLKVCQTPLRFPFYRLNLRVRWLKTGKLPLFGTVEEEFLAASQKCGLFFYQFPKLWHCSDLDPRCSANSLPISSLGKKEFLPVFHSCFLSSLQCP